MRRHHFDAPVVEALYDRAGAIFALGSGEVVFDSGERVLAHAGAVLCACAHPSGEGIVTGGDDGEVIWSRRDGAHSLLSQSGAWFDQIAASASGLIALANGRTVSVLDVRDPHFRRTLAHERPVLAMAFDAAGRRLFTAASGGVSIWFARIESQTPKRFVHAGAHRSISVSPDDRFIFTAMHDQQLHGWRLQDGREMRMGGYPGRTRAISYLERGRRLATSGARGVVIWPLDGKNGPMGREASEIGHEIGEQSGALVALVASATDHGRIVAGLSNGLVWWSEPLAGQMAFVSDEMDAGVSALAMRADGCEVVVGREDGVAMVAVLGQD